MRRFLDLIRIVPFLALLAACSKSPEAAVTRPAPAARTAYAPSETFSFAVVGDNRTDGAPNPAFAAILDAMKADRVHFALQTGDLIYADDAKTPDNIAALWSSYKSILEALPFPVHAAPGNHDFFDPPSAKLYQQNIGPTFHAFDDHNCRFIALDTTSDPDRLSDEQFAFLETQLQSAENKLVFVYLHVPPFSSGPWLKPSLNAGDSLRFHKKLLEHKNKIAAVFCGHEHLFGFVERDGIPYYITGGANNTLYNPPPLGGYHHYLLVTVPDNPAPGEPRFNVEVRPATPAGQLPAATRKLAPGESLEDFEEPHLPWAAWDNTIKLSSIDAPDRPGKKALRLDYDTRFCRTPVLYTVFPQPRNLTSHDALSFELFVPPGAPPKITLTCGIESANGKSSDAPAITLKPGWNSIALDLRAKWLAPKTRAAAKQLNIMLTPSTTAFPSWVALASLRTKTSSSDALPIADTFNAANLWNLWSDSAAMRYAASHATHGNSALEITFDPAQDPAAVLYTTFNPALDLSTINGLALDLFAPEDLAPGGELSLTLLHNHLAFTSPPTPIQPGANHLAIAFNDSWLPAKARTSIHSLRLTLTTPNQKTKATLALDHLRAQQQNP